MQTRLAFVRDIAGERRCVRTAFADGDGGSETVECKTGEV